jgi:hypothetical protein
MLVGVILLSSSSDLLMRWVLPDHIQDALPSDATSSNRSGAGCSTPSACAATSW